MNLFIKVSSSFFFCLLMASCAVSSDIEVNVKLERRKTNELLHVLDSISKRKPDFFYSKVSTSYSDTSKNLSFKTSIRMVKDSAINLLITYAKIPIYNSIITKDTISVMDKRSKCYYKEDLSYIKETFGVDFNYKNLEEIFLGLPIEYEGNQKYFQIHEPTNYIISSHRKHKIKRTEKKAKEDLVFKYYLTNEVNHLKRMEISSPSDSIEIVIDYKTRELIDEYTIPKDVAVKITTPRNNILIDLTYEKSEINQRQPLVYIIPEGYEKCEK
jgi:hypothetical protein